MPELVDAGTVTVELMDAASLRVSAQDPGCPDVIRDRRSTATLRCWWSSRRLRRTSWPRAARTVEPARRRRVGVRRRLTTDAAERATLWHVRKGLFTAVASARPSGTNALLEDVVVPVARLAATCGSLSDLFDRHHYERLGHLRARQGRQRALPDQGGSTMRST